MSRKGFSPLSTAALAAGLALLAAGCKSTVDDNTITNGVRSALSSDPTINGQPVQVAVQNGVVTLNGNVSDRTASSVAAQDAARVKGVREVVNNLQVAGLATPPTVTTAAAPMNPQPATPEERRAIERHQPLPPRAPVTRQPAPVPGPAPATTATVPPPAPAPAPYNPPPPPAPVVRNVNLAAGATIPVRITETLDSATTQPGQAFSGVVTHDITSEGYVVIPAGSPVSGRVLDARDAGHFSGHSLLSVELTSVRRRGQPMPLHTDAYTVEGKSRGTNTAEKVGGGAAVGAILGGIFGGGKGAAIGAAAGGSAGAGANAITRGQQVQIPSETVVRFQLTSPITVQTTEHASDRQEMPSSTLQTR